MLKRTEESKLTSWYFEIDRHLLALVLILVFIGMLFVVSAGSVVASVLHQPWYFFALKALPFYCIGLIGLFAVSMTNKKTILTLSFLDIAVGLLLLLVTVVHPHIIKGSARFVNLGFINVMPSDIMKPGFVILTAWFLANMKDWFGENIFFNKEAWKLRWKSWWPYLAIFVPAIFIVFRHPDVGTSMLYFLVFASMLFLAGLPWILLVGGIGAATILGIVAYCTMSHVHNRIDAWLFGIGDTYQVSRSILSIRHGGLFGSGDNAFIKEKLPDAHTDFIFAAISEDFGAIMACVVLVLLFLVIKRLTTSAAEAKDKFVFYATGGTAALFGAQVCINMLSTLGLMPPKGMTLPFISYGGSSFVGFCLLFGMILAIVREDKWNR